ncbi:PDR/VanB family oxidoreductase [Arthrobacter sp. I2-34]|uniref:PDR/VanB family oxidoreductase n=1 Tax=Arthrobacter hankyongi TaxID=2904801 RepID=A0ABS9LCE5_9MICC|nr:PDR/VanB family oxidoreductase [Arthrobacter hankyongi]MCG2624353.1 PDR/VanB family oxidoreductase [Arthrobacter hankyongi]
MGMFRVKVSEILEETDHIKSFKLVRADGKGFDPYLAGAHIDIVGPTNVVRQYSLCCPPYDLDAYLVAVKRETESRGGSAALHDQLDIGSELEVSAPRNLMQVAETGDRHVLVAAGIGVTPMISMAYQLEREGRSFELHYFARSRELAAFTELLEERCGFAEKVRFHFGIPRDEQPAVLQEILTGLTGGSHVYTCGPEGFMERVLFLAGPVVGEENVHIEHFQAGELADTSGDTGFEVELDSGEVFEIPADRSIVEVLQENGVPVDTSCKEGICGTCVMGVLEGEPEHRDNCLSASEKRANDQIATCVSRARSARLILEPF